MDIVVWLRSLGLGQYEAAFRENEIDETVLPNLTAEDLKDLGVGIVGHRRKLLDAIATLRADKTEKVPSADAAPPSTAASASPEDRAERRQVTVMFSDLVGSTALSARMDPEDLREVISAYQKCVAETVQRFGGFLAKYMGDGVLVYFGYPQAYEDDAERAVRAGLALVAAVSGLTTHTALQARVGIATGLVVVGDLIGSGASQEQAIVGETPNLAARLQGIAEPDVVVIAESTRGLVGNLFELEDLGPRDLKGISGPVRAWVALRTSSVESRFEAMHAGGLTELVGREEELQLLLRRWSKAKTGEGQVVLLSGEPGIGKSRLTAALLEAVAGEPHTRLRYFCSPQATDSALFPIISQMERAAGFSYGDAAQQKLDKLDALLAQTATAKQTAALFAEMLSLANDGRYPLLELAPQQRRQKTLEALTAQMEALARQNPVMMIFEDAHWADPTSLEAFGQAVDRSKNLRVLLVVTHRPEFAPPWIGQPQVTAVTLNRLAQRDIDEVIDHVAGNKSIPGNIRQDIIERTDGVPLFIEEMTKAVLEAESEGEARRTAAAVPSSAVAVPATLHASLMARLDRLGAAKEIAQIGAAIGREFSHALLSVVARKAEAELNAGLDRLVVTGLLLRQGAPPHATYLLKHALVRDAAYGMLLRETRRELHARIAETLERYPDDAARPEIIAHHLAEASLVDRAITYLRKAARAAINRWANAEAAEHLTRSLKLATQLPETAAREKVELDLLLELGPILMTVRGVASQEVQEVYRRAHSLCRDETEPAQLFAAKWGLWNTEHHHSRFEAAHHWATQLLDVAQVSGEPSLLLQAHHSAWTSLFVAGENQKALSHAQKGIEIYDLDAHRDHATRYGGHDPGVCANMMGGMAAWFSGLPAYAAEMSAAAIELGRMLGEPFSWAMALSFGGTVAALRREPAVVIARSAALQGLLARHQLALGHFGSTAKVLTGWAIATEGKHDEGRLTAEAGVAELRGSGWARLSFQLGMMAAVYRLVGDASAALKTLDEALQISQMQGETRWRSQLLYEKGLLLTSAGDDEKAEQAFSEGLEVSHQQKDLLPELRAATGLAKLWQDRGRCREARELLAPVYNWFTEGFDTLDLKEAKALLAELAAA
jgi:class 3 adenylate cyclase/tetratricopeptide (TPR) repeat protein